MKVRFKTDFFYAVFKASINKSISSFVLKWLNEIRKLGFFVSSGDKNSAKTCDGFTLPLWQALPRETAIPFISKANNNIEVFSSDKGN